MWIKKEVQKDYIAQSGKDIASLHCWCSRREETAEELITAANLALLWAKKCTKNSLLLLGSQIVGETCDDIHFNIYISFKKNNWN